MAGVLGRPGGGNGPGRSASVVEDALRTVDGDASFERLIEERVPVGRSLVVIDNCEHVLDDVAVRVEAIGALRPEARPAIVRGVPDSLGVGAADARREPRRHRSLDASVRWSVDRLGAPAGVAFRRLGAFADSFRFTAAVRVISEAGDGDDRQATRAFVELVEASLVRRLDDDRFSADGSSHARPGGMGSDARAASPPHTSSRSRSLTVGSPA